MMALSVGLISCSKDDIFSDSDSTKTGSVNFRKMIVDINAGSNKITRATEVNISDFLVVVARDGMEYLRTTYAEMPEVLVLPVADDYTVTVSSGEIAPAAWEAPAYSGSLNFNILEDKITDVGEVKCTIANVLVTVVFSEKLRAVMGPDCEVTVKTGSEGELVFKPSETRTGYFRFEGNEDPSQNTLVATFRGTVDENYEENFQTYTEVKPANHYVITYTLHDNDVPDLQPSGTVSGASGVLVNSTVSRSDIYEGFGYDDDLIQGDDRPSTGPQNPGSTDPDPDQPDQPVDPSGKAPVVTSNYAFDTELSINDIDEPSIKAVSEADKGIQVFTITIESETITEELLGDVGLKKVLDLAHSGDLAAGLESLGLPTNVAGQKEVEAVISSTFISLLRAYNGVHKFVITVGDANGTVVKSLIIKN